MKKTVFMSAAKKARIALAVMAVFGMSFVGAQEAFAEIHISGNDNTYTDAKDFSTIVGNKNKLTGKDYDGEITKFTVLGSENSVNAFYEYVLSEDLEKKNQITVVGTKNNIKGTRNTVVGDNNTVYFNESIVLGQNNSLNPWGLNSNSGKNILIGNDISAQIRDSNIAIGNKMTVEASWNTTVIGNESKSIGASEAVILGSNISAAYGRSVMVGNRTWAHANSVALGYNAVAAVADAEALGARSRAEKYFSVALGDGSLADEENTVSVGSNKERTITESNGTTITIPERYRRIVNMADGKNNHDAATFGQILKTKAYDITIDGTTGKGEVTLETNGGTVAGPTLRFDASALDKQIKQNASDITTVDGKIGTLGADGTYIKQAKNVSDNLVELDKQVKKNADDITIAKSTIHNVSSQIGTKYDGNYIHAVNPIGSDLVALDTQVKKNADAIGSLSANGAYIKKAKNVSENLVELDKQVNTNTTAIADKADKNLSNISAAGKDVIINLAGNKAGDVVDGKLGMISSTNYVSASGKVNENISALDLQVKANADGIASKANQDLSNINAAGTTKIETLAGGVVDGKLGTISSTNYVNASGKVNENISALDVQVKTNTDAIGSLSADGTYIKQANNVSENLVELDKQVNTNTTAIADKADKNLSNISAAGKNVIINLAGNKAGEVLDVKLGAITSTHYVNAGNTVNANISALDTQLNKVENKVGTMTDGNYISAGNTVAGNLSALDNQLKANADAINTKADKDLSNITDAGKKVIKDLAGNKAGEVVDAKLGDITSNNYVNAGNTVNANISALDKQMKVNTDNIGDTGKLTTAGLGSNLSDAVVNVNNKVGTAEELKALKDAKLGDNLAQATAAVNKKADKNAEDIKTVNGRVDELGGRVDTLGGAVSKLDTKVNKVGAGAAALAALHPMDFDSDNKLTFAAGVGSYHGASAAAIGAFYRPSEQVMFSISGNMGNGENMVNAGVSFALDRPSKTPTTKAALVKTVAAQNEQIAALSETVAEQNEKIARLEAMVEKLAAKQNA